MEWGETLHSTNLFKTVWIIHEDCFATYCLYAIECHFICSVISVLPILKNEITLCFIWCMCKILSEHANICAGFEGKWRRQNQKSCPKRIYLRKTKHMCGLTPLIKTVTPQLPKWIRNRSHSIRRKYNSIWLKNLRHVSLYLIVPFYACFFWKIHMLLIHGIRKNWIVPWGNHMLYICAVNHFLVWMKFLLQPWGVLKDSFIV